MSVWDLITDNDTVGGKLVTTAVIASGAVVVGTAAGRLLARRADDRYRKYYTRKIAHYVAWVVALIALAILWRPFAGQLGLVVGLTTAGLAFALQEVIGALAGWFNILSGSIFKVGDRVQVGGVRGDVIDITPLRTKVMEIGSGVGDDTWVRGRQYTGRIVAISNKASFVEPVYNYSATFEFIWEEITIPISYSDDWQTAERIITEEAVRISTSKEAEAAIAQMIRRYPVARTEVEPRVFVRATDNYLELAARFVVPVRAARSLKDELTRRILERLSEQGITIASSTQDVTIRRVAPDAPSTTENIDDKEI
ncbi:MAG: mechanosensitive ion channel domain-containing protein [Acidimicrobiales bacterium]